MAAANEVILEIRITVYAGRGSKNMPALIRCTQHVLAIFDYMIIIVNMNLIEDRLHELGSVLPLIAKPRGSYLSSLIVDKVLYLAGVISIVNGAVITRVGGADKAVEEGYTTARHCALIQFASIKRVLGLLDWLQQIISLNGHLDVISGFTPLLIDGASDFLVKLFGEKSLHVQAAVGVSALSRRRSSKSR